VHHKLAFVLTTLQHDARLNVIFLAFESCHISTVARTISMTKTLLALAATSVACYGIAYVSIESSAASREAKSLRVALPAETPRPATKIGHPSFVTPHASPIVLTGGKVFVTNTPDDTVDVIDASTRAIVRRVDVGISPVGLAVRPDGMEVWVANHTSDSVSVIDNNPKSPTYLQVLATIQDFDTTTKATRFDEPVGIAFASNSKAYVSLSSENKIAVINVSKRQVENSLAINAQDPRAIVVRGDRLYVLPFESNNKTQLSGGGGKLDGNLKTFDAYEHSIRNNNVLSIGAVVDIIKHPDVPDRDLYIFDTKTDKQVEVVDTLGTLLYGLTVDSKGRVFIAQTDARNDVNGRAGTKKHGLAELENRAFLNRITRVETGPAKSKASFIDLEPLPPQLPKKGEALATPFAIEVSGDDSTLVASAAGSDKLFTVDAATGKVLGRVTVEAVPEGIALESDRDGKPARAWVLNAAANSVSLVNLTDLKNPKVETSIALNDPTPAAVKRGRIAFTTASASTTGTFSCASCHPDGHTDQLLWVLKTPIVTGGNQIQPRSTMPVRGLRDTAPFHWDGIPGDPYGGINSASTNRPVPANSSAEVAESSTRHLVDGGLGSTMMMVGDKTVNDEGKAGELSKAQRDDMAKFLLSVPFPPAQRRAFDNELSSTARLGFKLFHVDGDNDPTKRKPNVCGDCHRMPFLVSTNTPGTGMDAPTWRGAYDRWLILPQGRLNIIDFDFYRAITAAGTPERELWRFSWSGRPRFDPVWNMVTEGSTGYSGSFARQVTLNTSTADGEKRAGYRAESLLHALETSAREGGVVLQGEGVLLVEGGQSKPLALEFDGKFQGGTYVARVGDRRAYTRKELISLASQGRFLGTFTARMGEKVDVDNPQPAIWTSGAIHVQRGRQNFPILSKDARIMKLSGRHIQTGAYLIVDGRQVDGTVNTNGEKVEVTFTTLPKVGMRFLQIQNPDGLFSNDFIFHVAEDAKAAAALKAEIDRPHGDQTTPLSKAVTRGDLEAVKKLIADGAKVNGRQSENGTTPLHDAALRGNLEMVKLLIKSGANVNASNLDGNTSLHSAAFLCRTEVVKALLENGASPSLKNNRGETAVTTVEGKWDKGLSDFYQRLGAALGFKVDLPFLEKTRPEIAKLLREHSDKAK
jgi:YVTN family beta-propeller protein